MFQYITHLLLDGAKLGTNLQIARQLIPASTPLTIDTPYIPVKELGGHLFAAQEGSVFSNWYLHTGWSNSWGIMFKSTVPTQTLATHLRKFIKINNEAGQTFHFRFYDPRVLRIFLPTCSPEQIREFFGNAIDYFIAEDEDPAFALRFSHQNGILQTERFPVKEYIDGLPEPQPLPAPAEDPLPPETIAALKAAGVTLPGMENVAPRQPQQAQEAAQPGPVPESASAPKPKTKWNMFD